MQAHVRCTCLNSSAIRACRPARCWTQVALVGASLLLAGCASSPGTREPWVYALSRDFYSSMTDSSSAQWGNCADGSGAIAMVCIFALPFALDTVLLPVTFPHDVLLVE